MVFTYVRWERGLVAGVASYLVGYLVMFSLSADTVRRAMATATATSGERVPPLAASVPSDVPRWKVLAWLWHGSLFSPMATHYPSRIGTWNVNPMTAIADTHGHLFLVAPTVLFVAGFVVVLGSWTPKPRCEFYTGAMTVLGFFACCYAGGVYLCTDQVPTDGPDLLTSAYRAGLLYPVAFGGLGGLLAKRVKAALGISWEPPPDELWAYDNLRTEAERRWE